MEVEGDVDEELELPGDQQVAAFREVIHGNNRTTQPLHGRAIVASR